MSCGSGLGSLPNGGFPTVCPVPPPNGTVKGDGSGIYQREAERAV
jgi:hypothetical protein